jgi:predicted acetyltransferase
VGLEVRRCTDPADFLAAAGPISHYFGRVPDEEWSERWLKSFELERMHAALVDGATVGGAGAFSLRLTVPGPAQVACAGVTVVGVLPTHRRRGILRAMMRAQLDDVHERGEPLAALWASEETIYGRYGYGLASLVLDLNVPRNQSEFRPGVETVRQVRLVDATEALTLLPPVYERVQQATPGMLERTNEWWEHRVIADPPEWRQGGGPKLYATLEVDGEALAYALYRLNVTFGNLGPETTMHVIEAVGATPAAAASIWRFLLDVDWTKTVHARLLPVDHPLLLLLARPNLARATVLDGLWVRLVDVGAALSARGYAADGAVVFEVADAFCDWNAGRWLLEDGRASRTDREPYLRLDVVTLASAYLGAFTFVQLARAGWVQELREGGLERADAMFRTDLAPWSPEIF